MARAGRGRGSPSQVSRTIYVSTTGNDNASGSKESPYAKINDALAKAIPGDTVMVRGGKYYEKVRFPKSGREGKLITLKAYPGERPILDGTGLTVTGKDAMVFIRNASYVVLEGFDICNFTSSAPG